MIEISDIFHMGFVVENLDAAMDEIATVMNVTWAPVTRRRVPLKEATTPTEAISFTYTTQGPVHIELLSAVPGSVWDGANPRFDFDSQAAHHIGVWTDDLASETERLTSVGAHRLSGSPYYRLRSGLLIEPVDRHRQPAFERWFAGSTFE